MPFLRDRLLGTDKRGVALLGGIGLCMMLGGGDVLVPWLDVVTQLAVALIALTWFWTAPRGQLARIPMAAWVIAGLVVALPLVQLIPLPPALWHVLPGRDLERQALALVGQGDSWRPWSMTPDRTLASALAAACAAIFVPMVAGTDRGGRSRIMMVIVTVGVLSVLVGSQQLTGGTGGFFQFYAADSDVLRGFQYNRNSEADVLLLAMLAATGCTVELLRLTGMGRWRRPMLALLLGLTVLFVVGTVLTRSRTGILLIVPVFLAQGWMLRQQIRMRPVLLLLPLAAGAVLAVLWGNSVLTGALGHFQDGVALRPLIWSGSLDLARQGMPLGLGLGGFGTAFARIETLDMVNPLYVAHAYQDYVQLVIEAGLPGLLVLVAVAAILGRAAWQGIAAPVEGSRAHYLFAVIALLMLAGHSVWDYPLHSTSLACVAACCAGMLLRPATVGAGEAVERSRGRRRSPRRSGGARVALVLGGVVFAGLALISGMDRETVFQADVAPWVPGVFAPAAHGVLARQAVIRQRPDLALQQARLAVAQAPMEAVNVGLLGVGYLQTGAAREADAVYLVADRMGWRDMGTQTYMMHRAIALGDYDGAVRRLDAILRQKPLNHRDPVVMDPIEANLYAQGALVRYLARRPPWMDAYISDVWGLAPEQLGVRASILADLADHGVRLGCDGIDQMVHQLVMRESFDDAHLLWTLHCPQTPGNLVWDGRMATLSDQPGRIADFRWQLVSSGDLIVNLYGMGPGYGGERRGQWIEVANNGAFPLSFVRQMLVLEPGVYRLRWIARNHDGRNVETIAPVVDCGSIAPMPRDGNYAQSLLTVGANCQRVRLDFQAAPQPEAVTFGDVELSRHGGSASGEPVANGQ